MYVCMYVYVCVCMMYVCVMYVYVCMCMYVHMICMYDVCVCMRIMINFHWCGFLPSRESLSKPETCGATGQ